MNWRQAALALCAILVLVIFPAACSGQKAAESTSPHGQVTSTGTVTDARWTSPKCALTLTEGTGDRRRVIGEVPYKKAGSKNRCLEKIGVNFKKFEDGTIKIGVWLRHAA